MANSLKLSWCTQPAKLQRENPISCLKEMTHTVKRLNNQNNPHKIRKTFRQALVKSRICNYSSTVEVLLVNQVPKSWTKLQPRVIVREKWNRWSRMDHNLKCLMIEENQLICVTSVVLVIKSIVTPPSVRFKHLSNQSRKINKIQAPLKISWNRETSLS